MHDLEVKKLNEFLAVLFNYVNFFRHHAMLLNNSSGFIYYFKF